MTDFSLFLAANQKLRFSPRNFIVFWHLENLNLAWESDIYNSKGELSFNDDWNWYEKFLDISRDDNMEKVHYITIKFWIFIFLQIFKV